METISRRPIFPEDIPFLTALYRTTREEELSKVPHMGEEEKQAFVAMQFELQKNFYEATYPDGEFEVITEGGDPIGRYYRNRKSDVLHIIDLLLLPSVRGRGIGSHLLKELMDEGQKLEVPVTIYLQKSEKSWGLFERLGFEVVAENGVNFLMEWLPPKAKG